jgi:hypothetical protein
MADRNDKGKRRDGPGDCRPVGANRRHSRGMGNVACSSRTGRLKHDAIALADQRCRFGEPIAVHQEARMDFYRKDNSI